MSDLLKKYDYKNILKNFEEIAKIPHGSGNVRQISDFLFDFAKKHGMDAIQDESCNVIVRVPASEGFENKKTVMLQGHMDMVCEKTVDSKHDFTKDGLELFVDGDYLGAKDTTLGGDDGIAIAYMMTIIEDRTIKHPALILIMTTDEETGMYGAKALDMSLLTGDYLINLDSEEEGICYCGCAGGMRADIKMPVTFSEREGDVYDISITGLKGGHSGVEIDKNRTNANKLMSRFLFELLDSVDYSLVSINGGKFDNAIPASCFARICTETDTKEILKAAEELISKYRKEAVSTEPGLTIDFVMQKEKKAEVVDVISFQKLLFFLVQSPNGIQKMSGSIPGLVESSLNMGVISTRTDSVNIRFSLRSSVSSYKHFMRDKIDYLACFLGGECEFEGEYPAWEYKNTSLLRDVYAAVYKAEYKAEPVFKVMHAGLECGLIFDKLPNIDIISFGPELRAVHSPDERMSLSSAVRVFKFLEKLIVSL